MSTSGFNKSPWLILTGFGLPVLVLWLSMTFINNRVTFFSQADLNNSSELDKGELVWLVSSTVPVNNENITKVSFRMNSMDTDIDNVMLRMRFPSENFEIKTITSGVFGVIPEYVINKNDLYISINNISMQGNGDLFTIQLGNIQNVDKIEFVKNDTYARTKSGRVTLDLPVISLVKI